MPIWNGKFSTEREEQLTGFLWWCARLFWLVKQLSNYPIHRHGEGGGWGIANTENSLLHQVYTVSGRNAVCTE